MTVLGIDIGGSGIKAAPVDLATGKLAAERLRIPTPQPATPAAIARVVSDIVQHFNWTGPIGCGLPAVVQNGTVRTAANIDRSWIGANAKQLMAQATGCQVTVINDADAAGIAEMRFGSGVNRQDTVLLITVGTGLGTALFRRGFLVPNTEFGHILLEGQSAEHYASAATKERRGLSYEQWATRFNHYLHRLQELLWPDLFIIGGEISRDFAAFQPFLTMATELQPAALKNDAGIVGAALATQSR